MSTRNPSRREFLSRAAAAGAAGAVGGCASTGAPIATHEPIPEPVQVAQAPPERKPIPERRTPGPNEKIRLGFIGAGSRGGSVLQAMLKFGNDVDVVAVCDSYDVWRDRAAGWCRRNYSGVTSYIRFEDMMDKEDLHAVAVATPDHIHFPAIMYALDRGLDVYTEKPMTLTWEEAKAVRDRVAETNAILQVGTQLRSMDMYQKAREIVQSGGIGQLTAVHVNRHSAGGSLTRRQPPNEANSANIHWDVFLRNTQPYTLDLRRYFLWRLYQEYSNGVSGDLMVHHLDLCHFITGCRMPERVMSVGGIYVYDDGRTVPDTVSTLIEYPEKFHFNYTTTLTNAHYGLVERYLGTEGTLEVTGMGAMTVYRRDYEEKVQSPGIRDEPHVEDFFRAIRSRRQPIAPAQAGLMAAACAHMAVLSEQSGEAVKWDAATEQAYI